MLRLTIEHYFCKRTLVSSSKDHLDTNTITRTMESNYNEQENNHHDINKNKTTTTTNCLTANCELNKEPLEVLEEDSCVYSNENENAVKIGGEEEEEEVTCSLDNINTASLATSSHTPTGLFVLPMSAPTGLSGSVSVYSENIYDEPIIDRGYALYSERYDPFNELNKWIDAFQLAIEWSKATQTTNALDTKRERDFQEGDRVAEKREEGEEELESESDGEDC
jgi:hypothetical protein